MATKLTKPVVRETSAVHAGRPIVVTLGPGWCISFRLKGCRKTYTTTVPVCFWMAAKAEAREQARLRQVARIERKKSNSRF